MTGFKPTKVGGSNSKYSTPCTLVFDAVLYHFDNISIIKILQKFGYFRTFLGMIGKCELTWFCTCLYHSKQNIHRKHEGYMKSREKTFYRSIIFLIAMLIEHAFSSRKYSVGGVHNVYCLFICFMAIKRFNISQQQQQQPKTLVCLVPCCSVEIAL
jgi:hypothetical protein